MATDVRIEFPKFPPRHQAPEVMLPTLGTVSAKKMNSFKLSGEKQRIFILFENVMPTIAHQRVAPKKIVGMPHLVYPDFDYMEDVPFPLGDTRQGTALKHGRDARHRSRKSLFFKAERQDRLIYPFFSIGSRVISAAKEKEHSALNDLIRQREPSGKYRRPEIADRINVSRAVAFQEPKRPNVTPQCPDFSKLFYNYEPVLLDPSVLKGMRHRNLARWRGRLHPRRSGADVWPTVPKYYVPKGGAGAHSWGPWLKGNDIEVKEGDALFKAEWAKNDWYDSQPSEDVPAVSLMDFLPLYYQDMIYEAEEYEEELEFEELGAQPVFDRRRDVQVETPTHADYYTRLQGQEAVTKKKPYVSKLDRSAVRVETPTHADYYTRLLEEEEGKDVGGTTTLDTLIEKKVGGLPTDKVFARTAITDTQQRYHFDLLEEMNPPSIE